MSQYHKLQNVFTRIAGLKEISYKNYWVKDSNNGHLYFARKNANHYLGGLLGTGYKIRISVDKNQLAEAFDLIVRILMDAKHNAYHFKIINNKNNFATQHQRFRQLLAGGQITIYLSMKHQPYFYPHTKKLRILVPPILDEQTKQQTKSLLLNINSVLLKHNINPGKHLLTDKKLSRYISVSFDNKSPITFYIPAFAIELRSKILQDAYERNLEFFKSLTSQLENQLDKPSKADQYQPINCKYGIPTH